VSQRCAECGDEFTRTDKWVDCCPDHERMGVVEAVLLVIAVLACLSVAGQAAGAIL
jgi:hypothetical protein